MDMRHQTSKALFTYWNSVRADRLAPRRFEIEPSEIAHILSSTFILEHTDMGVFRFRLAGTAMCDAFGVELRGASFMDGWSHHDRLTLERGFTALTGQAAGLQLQMEAAPKGRPSTPFEVLMLPLRHTGDRIDRVLGSFSLLEPPVWLGHAVLQTKRLISHDFIWPTGGSLNALADVPPEPPMLMHGAHARIVRSDRRQFRVFEGGLSQGARDES